MKLLTHIKPINPPRLGLMQKPGFYANPSRFSFCADLYAGYIADIFCMNRKIWIMVLTAFVTISSTVVANPGGILSVATYRSCVCTAVG